MRWCDRFIQSKWALLLLPIGWIWDCLSSLRHKCYDVGIFRTYKVAVPVISVGNIAVGGTGKTPLVILLGKTFSTHRVAILSRGYGGGDETKVIQRHLPQAMLYEDADRVRAAKKAIAEGAQLLILDDGFQHRRLHRDFDLVIVRPQDFRGRCLPAGQLRENPRRLKKAIVLSELKIKAHCPVSLIGKRVAIFCGIGHPERFKQTVSELGGIIVAELYLGDHEPIGWQRLHDFYTACKALQITYLLCTEKDEVKLPPHHQLPLYAVRIETERAGLENLIEKMKQTLDNTSP